jgi:hypothetical protein
MKGPDADLDRLLHAAARSPDESPAEPPFGFATRVLAAWRSGQGSANDVADLTRFLRRTGVIAFAILTIASAAAYRQFRENAAFAAPQTNEYAIADSQIQTEFLQ